jgi:hypothetical protein
LPEKAGAADRRFPTGYADGFENGGIACRLQGYASEGMRHSGRQNAFGVVPQIASQNPLRVIFP